MKAILFLLCMFTSGALFAQNTIFAGKIMEKGRPVMDARIYVKGAKAKADAKSDELGLFHTQDLPEGDYSVTAVINGKRKANGKVHVASVRGEKRYYMLQVEEGNLKIATTDKDLFIEAKLEHVRKSQENIDVPVHGQTMYVPRVDVKQVVVPQQRQLQKK